MVSIYLKMVDIPKYDLVGGWYTHPLKKKIEFVNWDDEIPN